MAVCSLACAVLVAASGASAQQLPEEDTVEVKIVQAEQVEEPEPEPAPVIESAKPPPPNPGPRGPRLQPLSAPTAVPTEKPAEADAPIAPGTGDGTDMYADIDASRGGPAGPAPAAPVQPEPVERPKPAAPKRPAGPVQLPENATPPVVLSRAEPAYPEEARQQGIEATVVVKFAVSETGQVTNVRIVRGHPLFNDVVTLAVSQWKYKPAMFEGRAIAVYRVVRFPFKLKT